MSCLHCGLPAGGEFCCRGCEAAYRFLHASRLDRFYALRGARGVAVGEDTETREHADPAMDALVETANAGGVARLDLQGVHCVGCVWLIEELFRRRASSRRIDLDPTRGHVILHVAPGFDLRAFAAELSALGYRLGTPADRPEGTTDDLLMRIGVCVALAGNVMFYAIAVYLGLDDSPLRFFLERVALAAGALSVWIGGSVFIRAALMGVRRGVVSMDLPIALGIVLAFAGALWRFFLTGDSGYVDTLTVFIALMLIGRYVQNRALERSRRRLLPGSSGDGLYTRRLEDGVARTRPCRMIVEGDELALGRGDLVPVDARLKETATFTLDWITGEPESRRFGVGEVVPAGAFAQSASLVRATAVQAFSQSIVPRLLTETRSDDPRGVGWWSRTGLLYVAFVLTASASAAAFWVFRGEPRLALDVATAILVVTCPCAFGIALPMARELAHARLRRVGLHVRTSGFLERLFEVRQVVFDKTGTLTTGRPSLAELPRGLSAPDLRILAGLAQSSLHPRSRAVADALPEAPPLEGAVELPGKGVEGVVDGRRYRLGQASWVLGHESVETDDRLCFGVDGELVAALDMVERLRVDAADEVEWLERRARVVIASGDAQPRVAEVARTLGVETWYGRMSPEGKAAYIEENDPERTLMVGDGLNDHLALLAAGCAGTPAVERPFVASRCDFYLTAGGLAPIRHAFETADWLVRTQRLLLGVALSYNVLAVALAWSGHVVPWVAAVLMPLSSLLTLGLVALRAAPWRTHPLEALA